jgi:dimethylaniline monooxygenase (N-oxide forming)
LKQYDTIISATGYRTAHDSLPETLKSRVSSNGLLMYRLTVEPDHQNYWFIGWAESFTNTLTQHLQILWLIHNLLERTTFPTPDKLTKDMEKELQWREQIMFKKVHNRFHLLMAYFIQYHDLLVSDMGYNPLRKKSWWDEMWGPYHPSDYIDLFK